MCQGVKAGQTTIILRKEKDDQVFLQRGEAVTAWLIGSELLHVPIAGNRDIPLLPVPGMTVSS